ncbi:hypothetical protein V5O48_017900 [Marasmius crinis-equi]|uniref:MACPF domain-containing protein n=1 Tax=Marasmius crinis-equi TaxID=585013 RepID=A0ABR3EMP4_9AGAR
MLTVTPLSIKAVDESIKRGCKIIDYDPDWRLREVKLGDQTYKIPGNIGVSTDLSNFQGSFLTFGRGSEAYNAFQADTSLSIRYMSVSGGASASYATEKTLRRENQHAFYSFNTDLFAANLRDYVDSMNEPALKRGAVTHRPFQNVWASNSSSSVNNRFGASVAASYNGVFTLGQFDASVKQEEQYKDFMEMKQADVTVQGGDSNAGVYLVQHPDSMEAYDAWGKTVASYPDVTNLSMIEMIEIWSLLRDATVKELRDAADQLEKAFNHLKMHMEVHRTEVTLSIESDWAEFGLLAPSACIVKPSSGDIPHRTIFSETKVQWGKEYGHDYHQRDIRFVIVNDGSPINFYISHGSNGSARPGKATIITEQGTYTNDKITDGNLNTEWYYQKPVNPSAENTRLSGDHKPRSWNDTLTDYLEEIGHY